MRTGELAERSGVGVETIRYYERRGLLAEPVRTPGGYREYDGEAVVRMHFILRCKDLGFSLSEIRELVDLRVAPGSTAADVRRRARAKVVRVEAKITDLERIRAALGQLISTCHAHGPADQCALMHAINDSTGSREPES
jgi:MerR family transcriptional regulator, copper efflux regulator